jgi:hypothetical protein
MHSLYILDLSLFPPPRFKLLLLSKSPFGPKNDSSFLDIINNYVIMQDPQSIIPDTGAGTGVAI